VFNNRRTWDSYRGALRSRSEDFRRVAIHEFGHVLGLDHPDEAGQRVSRSVFNNRRTWDSYRGPLRSRSEDFRRVAIHEFGHVLGAGHGQHGLMAPVYSLDGARCIDYAAAGLVAQAQRLPLAGMNWCEGLGRERMPAANAGANHGYTSSSVRGQARD